jgi:hypothetical protein
MLFERGWHARAVIFIAGSDSAAAVSRIHVCDVVLCVQHSFTMWVAKCVVSAAGVPGLMRGSSSNYARQPTAMDVSRRCSQINPCLQPQTLRSCCCCCVSPWVELADVAVAEAVLAHQLHGGCPVLRALPCSIRHA